MLLGVIGDKVFEGINYIFLIIDSFIYGAVNKIYKVYMTLAGARIFSSNLFSAVANRIYAVIGIVMLFVLAYTLIQGIISPDKITKGAGSGGEIIKRVLRAVIGLAIVPAVFNLAYRGQDAILANDVIGKIFLGFDDKANVIRHDAITIDGQTTVEAGEINQNEGIKSQAGTITAVSIWQAFFYATDTEDDKAASKIEAKESPIFIKGLSLISKFGCGLAIASIIFSGPVGILGAATICGAAKAVDSAENLFGKVTTLEQAYGAAAGSGNFGYFPAFAKNVVEGDIQYVLLLSTIAGLICIYLFLSFAIDMAVRAAKLAFLELIAPVPLMMQIMPNNQETYTKWYKNCLSLFFEVFIRLAMVYVIVYLIAHLGTVLESAWAVSIKEDKIANVVLKILLIFGLLIFAKEAPQFITNALGIKADLTGGIGIRSKLDKGGVFAVGAATGAIGANILSGTGRGIMNARNKWKENSDKTAVQRGLASVGSLAAAPFMGIGQGVRSTKRAIFEARGPHAPHDVREMMNMINDNHTSTRANMEKSRQKKEDKQKEISNRAGVEKDDNVAVAGIKRAGATLSYTTDKMAASIRNFTGIPRDTTYYAEQYKLASDMAALAKELESTIVGTQKVKDAVEHTARMKSDKTTEGLALKYRDATHATLEDVYADQDLMKKVYAEQNGLIHQAEEQEKVAKADAIKEALAEGALGKDNATTRKLAEFMDEKHDLLSKHAKDRTSTGETLEEKYKAMFGDGVFGGAFNFDKAAQDGNSSMDIRLTGNDSAGQARSGTISLRTKMNQATGKEERKYFYTDDSGTEQAATSLREAMAGLGISELKTSKVHNLGVANKKDVMADGLLDAIRKSGGGDISLGPAGTLKVQADGSYIDPSGAVLTDKAALTQFMADKQVEVSEQYLKAMQQSAGMSDWEVHLDVGGVERTIRYDSSTKAFRVMDATGLDEEVKDLAAVAGRADITGGTIKSTTVYEGEKDSIVSSLKSGSAKEQTYVLSSPEYQEAMRNKQASSSGGGKK